MITACTLILPFLAFPTILAEGISIVVPTDYPDIQTALDHASDGDIIAVLSGTYNGFEVKKSVTIIGESNETVIVKGPVKIYANNVKISTLRILLQDYTKENPAALWTHANDTVLLGVNVESAGSGILVGNASIRASIDISYSTIISGLEYEHSAGVATILCSSLNVFYSNITVVRGDRGIDSCKQLQVMYSTITTLGNGISLSMFNDQAKISYNVIKASESGIYTSASNSIIDSNVIISSRTGIYMSGVVRFNRITNNTIHGSAMGIQLIGNDNYISGNYIGSGGPAIELRGSGNTITNNTLEGSRGVNGLIAYGNTISFNLINRTGSVGIYLSNSSGDNVVFGNTFWYCYNYNAVDESGGNQWYVENNTLKMGNYWYDHTEPDNNNDGIVDVPYAIATTLNVQIIDKYPLAKPVHSIIYTTTTTTPSTMTFTTTPTTVTETPTGTQITTPETTTQETTTTTEEGALLTIAAAVAVLVLLPVLVAFLLFKRRSRSF